MTLLQQWLKLHLFHAVNSMDASTLAFATSICAFSTFKSISLAAKLSRALAASAFALALAAAEPVEEAHEASDRVLRDDALLDMLELIRRLLAHCCMPCCSQA